jgi:hypothetical protein
MAYLLHRGALIRLNTALALGLVWGGLAICAFGASIYDIAQLFSAH